MSDFTQILKDGLVPLVLNISCWTGQKKLTAADLGLRSDQVPTDKFAALGNKKMFDPKVINRIMGRRTAAREYLNKVAVRFMGGWAISRHHLTAVTQFLGEREQEFNQLVQELGANYTAQLNDWADECEASKPGLGDIIKEAAPDSAQVMARYGWEVIIQDDAVIGIGDTLLDEIAQRADEFLDSLVGRKGGFDRRAFLPLREIRDKLAGLIFVDSAIRPVVARIDTFLAGIPCKGKLDANWLQELVSEMSFLSKPKSVRQWSVLNASLGEGISDGQLADSLAESDGALDDSAPSVEQGGDDTFEDCFVEDGVVSDPAPQSSTFF